MNPKMQRRDFLKLMSAGVAGAGAMIGTMAVAAQTGTETPVPTTEHDGMSMDSGGAADWQAMNQHHEAGVKTYLDNIGKDPVFWRQPLEFTMDGDVKVFEISVQEIDWETAPGMVYPAMSYNGIVPGPEIRVTEGDKVRVMVTNEMSQSTAVHFHGLIIPNNVDGVPFVTQSPINPGETASLEFTTRNFGSHMYHSHHNAAEQTTRGLLGAFIIAPKDASREPKVDGDYVLVLNDSALGFTLNGKSFPYT
ncbi:MAG TPA: multicopper oxidase domain-containing protein, partial [Phototrophicaceae bacterium]|nr:multicopper oxidase domain-containing protein [Phototrophicaceae bacterium]